MKSNRLGIISVLLFTTALIPLVVSDASAKCGEDPNCFGTPMFTSLKTQVLHHYDLPYITCPNQDHWLVERPTGELACITERMAEKTGWYVHYEKEADLDKIELANQIIKNVKNKPDTYSKTLENFSDLFYKIENKFQQ